MSHSQLRFFFFFLEGSDECALILSSSLIQKQHCNTTRRALSAQKRLSNLNKGETVDAAGLTRGACWSCRVGGGALTVDLKVFHLCL